MKRKVLICLIIIFIVPLMARAQDTIVPEYKNNVKINTAALIFDNISLLYERKLNQFTKLPSRLKRKSQLCPHPNC